MTRDEIMALESTKLSEAVAEHVMGWRRQTITVMGRDKEALIGPGGIRYANEYPDYAEDIAAAWQVVERLAELEKDEGLPFDVTIQTVSQGWMCTVNSGCATESEVRADTAPLAICRAALLAVCGEEQS